MHTDFEQGTITDLASIKEILVGIREHLSILNGRVAAQEQRTGELMLEQAVRKSQCPLVDTLREDLRAELSTIRDYVVGEKAKRSLSAGLMEFFKPMIWAIAGAIGWIGLQHAGDLIKYFAK
jgi:hypothetical protein